MRPRIAAGRFLIRLGRFIHSLAPAVMRPGDLIEFSRRCYAAPDQVESFCGDQTAGRGLSERENDLLAGIPLKSGRMLLLGAGGGREAIPLARKGFAVTVVDYVPEMVRRTLARAREMGLEMAGEVQEISGLEAPADSFDIAWLSAGMYSCIPTRKRREDALKRIAAALRPGGYFLTQMIWQERAFPAAGGERLRRFLAIATRGNIGYETGDRIWNDREFMHVFSSEEDVRAEFAAGGLKVLMMKIFNDEGSASLIGRKEPHSPEAGAGMKKNKSD